MISKYCFLSKISPSELITQLLQIPRKILKIQRKIHKNTQNVNRIGQKLKKTKATLTKLRICLDGLNPAGTIKYSVMIVSCCSKYFRTALSNRKLFNKPFILIYRNGYPIMS